MRAQEFVTEDNGPTRLKLGNNNAAQTWIEKVYAKYPQQFQNNHVMPMGGTDDDQQFAMFELVPSFSRRGAVEVKWFQAYPLRAGVGSRAMKELQAMAREDGISLTLFPWDKGQVSQSKLTKFYKGQGFTPAIKGSKNMQWDPSVNESAEPQAAGCVIVAEDTGRWCLQQRSDTVSDPGVWSTWGGGREPGESLEQCARRELAEESGYRGPVRLEPLSKNAKYMTFIGVVPREFEPAPSDEWKDYCWTELGKWPSPMHPGTAAALENVYINEVFNTQAKGAWKVVPKWMGMDKFEFTASNGIGSRVDFLDPGVGPEEMGPESFSFHLGLGDDVWDKIYDRAKFLEFEQTNINDPYGQGKQGIEGTGAAAEVLGSVANAVYQYIKKNKPSMLYFQAVEPNRRRLYTAMVNRLLKALPGWGFELAGPSDSYFAIYNTRLLKSKPAVAENFADGKVKGKSRPGRVKRAGASCNGSVTDLRNRAKAASGEKAKMYHWCANMKSGRKK